MLFTFHFFMLAEMVQGICMWRISCWRDNKQRRGSLEQLSEVFLCKADFHWNIDISNWNHCERFCAWPHQNIVASKLPVHQPGQVVQWQCSLVSTKQAEMCLKTLLHTLCVCRGVHFSKHALICCSVSHPQHLGKFISFILAKPLFEPG